ncbi:ABC transporter substrate-binding protein [Rhodococcus sp. NPDC059968]|uniref:ABC transporter substrate-binding protein n=1 Tax=Rhodococcus sp. NPDC059968 TaxID=3347017 RepID=UPI003671E587
MKRTGPVVPTVVAAALCSALLGGCGDADPAGASGEGGVKLCASVEQTGGAASLGGWFEQGLEIATQEINSGDGLIVDGKKVPFELVVADNESNPETGLAVQKRFEQSGCKFIFAPALATLTGPILQSTRDTDDALMLTIASSAVPHLGTDKGANLFMPKLDFPYALPTVVEAAADRYAPKTAAVVMAQDASGEAQQTAIVKALEDRGIKVVYDDFFDPTTRDFAPYIDKIKRTDPDMVFAGYVDSMVSPILKAAVEAGFTQPVFVGTSGVSSKAFADNPGIPNGVVALSGRAVDVTDDPDVQAYRDAFAEKYGSPPTESGSSWGVLYYESIRMLAKAMEIAGTTDDLTAISKAMTTDEAGDYEGRTIDMTFDAKHHAFHSSQVGFVNAGQISEYVLIEPKTRSSE